MNPADAGATAPLLGLHGVSVRFGAVLALDRVSFELQRGEFVALVGANGSGKTTLLRALHGMLALRGGTRVIGAPGAVQAMVYQRPFMLRLSALNNLRLALWLAGQPRRDWPMTCERALRRVGLQGCADRPARALSSGQQQRLALARAWAIAPSILFLDEPTSSLDPSAKKEVELLLAGFAAEGMTLVMCTHNLGQAKRLASRVVYLEQGQIRVDLPSREFFSDRLDTQANLFIKGEMAWTLD